MFHRSERLLLRPIWPEDWQSIFGGIADEGVVRNLASAPWPYREDDAREFARRGCDPLRPRFLVTCADNATVVGCIGIDKVEEYPDAIEMGYWIARPYWGLGYATEAGRAVLEIALALGHERVVASHFLDNPASGKVLNKLGFEPTGRIVARHSCARGKKAPTVEYERELEVERVLEKRAA
ncbi:MAG: GNAT family N-acetyltransferase [Pseudomonadota bacterium]